MSSGKHFINEVEDPVECGLKHLLRQDHSLTLIESEKVLYRQQSTPKVLLLSGGGSGHEPAHAGYLGEGMLDICVRWANLRLSIGIPSTYRLAGSRITIRVCVPTLGVLQSSNVQLSISLGFS